VRTYRAQSPIAALNATVPVGRLIVHAREGIPAPVLTLAPQVHGDELAEQAIRDAEITEHNGVLRLAVPHRGGAGGVNIANINGGVHIVSGRVSGSVIQIGSGITIVNGVVNGNAGKALATGAVDAELIVPAHLHAELASTSGSITTDGPLGVVTAHTTNGDIDIADADALTAGAYNGSITAGRVARIRARSNNGNVEVDTVTDHAVLDTTNGNIHVSRAETDRLSAHTVNGNVTVTQGAGVTLPATAVHTVNGRVRVR
jgi:DUF4097 and DUF4098 domain-containing protein YvlB